MRLLRLVDDFSGTKSNVENNLGQNAKGKSKRAKVFANIIPS